MDIKDFILIGGGLLIAAVIAHGFWIAWRGRREPLRLDIVPDIIRDDVDDIDRLRGELPNGGARVATRQTLGEQEMLELEPAPILLEPTPAAPRREPRPRSGSRPENKSSNAPAASQRAEPLAGEGASATRAELPVEPVLGEGSMAATPAVKPAIHSAEPRAKVAEVILDNEPAGRAEESTGTAANRSDGSLNGTVKRSDVAPAAAPGSTDSIVSEQRGAEQARRPRRPAARKDTEKSVEPAPQQPAVEELIVMNVLAPRGEPFSGDALFAALRGKGLKFGDMNIFHRVDAKSRKVNYSVANVVEPGTFDMADMESFQSPGLCFFLQLPGPEHPARVFEDMLSVARAVTAELGGELKDEQRSFVTPQTVEHYRQRIADFCRRRMSRRA